MQAESRRLRADKEALDLLIDHLTNDVNAAAVASAAHPSSSDPAAETVPPVPLTGSAPAPAGAADGIKKRLM
jgi:hypothetical protein